MKGWRGDTKNWKDETIGNRMSQEMWRGRCNQKWNLHYWQVRSKGKKRSKVRDWERCWTSEQNPRESNKTRGRKQEGHTSRGSGNKTTYFVLTKLRYILRGWWLQIFRGQLGQPVHPKGDQSWLFVGRTDAEAEAPIIWPPDVKSWLTRKDSDAGKD